MFKVVRIDLHDGLLLPSGFLAQASHRCLLYVRVPEAWTVGATLDPARLEAVLENLYGKTWRNGNEDGSAYRVLDLKTAVLSDQEVADQVWMQPPPGASSSRRCGAADIRWVMPLR